jgi:hypothetical protein
MAQRSKDAREVEWQKGPHVLHGVRFCSLLDRDNCRSQPCNACAHVSYLLFSGIRCERATALLNQMSAVNPDAIKPKAVYELRGGIERYMKAFPEGGFWKGKELPI